MTVPPPALSRDPRRPARPAARRAGPRLAAAALGLALAAGAAQAQRLPHTPAPGLWENEMTLRVNGKDVLAEMRAAQEAMLASMPPAQRAQMAAMMQAQGGMMGGKPQHCLTPAEAAKASDARSLLAQLQEDAPECRFEPVEVSGATVRFEGRCADAEGFTGDVSGETTIESPKALIWRYEGRGRMAGIEDMPGMAGAGNAPVLMVAQGRNRWIAASCGSVKPAER